MYVCRSSSPSITFFCRLIDALFAKASSKITHPMIIVYELDLVTCSLDCGGLYSSLN